MKKIKLGGLFFNLAIGAALLAGVGLLAYPTLADLYNRRFATRAIAGYEEAVSNLNEEEFARLRAEAERYNAWLKEQPGRFSPSEEDTAYYNSVLDVTGTGIMAYIEIPSIHVSLPIYHGIEETTLAVAAGHLEGSSLPIGGAGNHAALSGHTGLPSAKLFNDLVKLEEGDQFAVKVLGETLTYEIDRIETVLPDDFGPLEFDGEKDLCTLITCTPYGVNSHRLMVRGRRVEAPQ